MTVKPPLPILPAGWDHRGNMWMHAMSQTTVLIVGGRIKSVLTMPDTFQQLTDTGDALASLGRWLAEGGRP